jgi:hypothetical protein
LIGKKGKGPVSNHRSAILPVTLKSRYGKGLEIRPVLIDHLPMIPPDEFGTVFGPAERTAPCNVIWQVQHFIDISATAIFDLTVIYLQGVFYD